MASQRHPGIHFIERHVLHFVLLMNLCHQFLFTVLGLKIVGICFAELKEQAQHRRGQETKDNTGEDRRGQETKDNTGEYSAGPGRVDRQILFPEDQLESLKQLGPSRL
jgi:hypothetical protein